MDEQRVIKPTQRVPGTQQRMGTVANLIVNVNKLNSMYAGCHIEVPREIMLKKVINMKSMYL